MRRIAVAAGKSRKRSPTPPKAPAVPELATASSQTAPRGTCVNEYETPSIPTRIGFVNSCMFSIYNSKLSASHLSSAKPVMFHEHLSVAGNEEKPILLPRSTHRLSETVRSRLTTPRPLRPTGNHTPVEIASEKRWSSNRLHRQSQ
jgi:hypothetical protein